MSLNCTFTGQLPDMHFPKALSKQRNQWFSDHQLIALNGKMPTGHLETEYFYYSKDLFTGFLNQYVLKANILYLRLFFAAIDGKLDIVYATNDPAAAGSELYYRFFQNPDPHLSKFETLAKGAPDQVGTASYFHNQFLLTKVPAIIDGSGIADPTRSVIFKRPGVDMLVAEMNVQGPLGLKMCFSSYTDTDPDPDRAKRMFFNFVFTAKNDSTGREDDAYIDDCPNYPGRKTIATMVKFMEGVTDTPTILSFFDFDNGTMCPPNPTCPLFPPL